MVMVQMMLVTVGKMMMMMIKGKVVMVVQW
jgi:hypothetical protein